MEMATPTSHDDESEEGGDEELGIRPQAILAPDISCNTKARPATGFTPVKLKFDIVVAMLATPEGPDAHVTVDHGSVLMPG